jgi:hypothetical protein
LMGDGALLMGAGPSARNADFQEIAFRSVSATRARGIVAGRSKMALHSAHGAYA